jgi:hypothetical protein
MTLCEVETQRTNNSDIGEKLPEYWKSSDTADILFILGFLFQMSIYYALSIT